MAKVLKILSGTHLGAQAELPPQGTLTMGRGEECDLILDDLLAAEEHARLTAGPAPGAVSIVFLSPGFVGERPAAAGHTQPLADWEVVTLGATQFCVGPGEVPWKTPSLPDWQKLQALVREEEARRTGAAASEGGAPDGAPEAGEPAADAPAAEESVPGTPAEGTAGPEAAGGEGDAKDSTEANEEKSAPAGEPGAEGGEPAGGNGGGAFALRPGEAWSGRRRRLLVAAAAGLIVLAFAPAFFLIPGTGEVPLQGKAAAGAGGGVGAGTGDVPSDPAAVRKLIEEICARYGLTRTDADGKWVVSGIVQDTAAAQSIREALRAGAEKVELRLFSTQQLLRAAEAVIKGFGYPVKVSVADDGVVNLQGSVPGSREMKLVLSRLQSDVPGARRFDLDLELLSQVNDTLTSELTSLGLHGVKMELKSAVLRSEGIVPPDRLAAWREMLESWKKRFPHSIQSIEDRTRVEDLPPEPPAPQAVAVAAETSAPLPSPIASIRLRPLPSFQTRDGSVYFDKAPLGNGYQVDGIELTGVWIRPLRGGGESERSWVGLGQAAPAGWN